MWGKGTERSFGFIIMWRDDSHIRIWYLVALKKDLSGAVEKEEENNVHGSLYYACLVMYLRDSHSVSQTEKPGHLDIGQFRQTGKHFLGLIILYTKLSHGARAVVLGSFVGWFFVRGFKGTSEFELGCCYE